MCFEALEDLLWRVVETLELSEFVRDRRSVKGHIERDVTSVGVLARVVALRDLVGARKRARD